MELIAVRKCEENACIHRFIEDTCTPQIHSNIREYICFGTMNGFSSHLRTDKFRTGPSKETP